MSVDAEPLSIVIYPTSNLLRDHPQIEQIVPFVNHAYNERNKERLSGDRVLDADDLIAQLGMTSLVVLVSSSPSSSSSSTQHAEVPVFYALGAARRWEEPEEVTVWSPRIPPDEAGEFDRWEVKVICTNPAVDRQGLGALVMDTLELAIKRRHRAIAAQQSQGLEKQPRRRLQIVLSSIREITGEFYRKRGFEPCHEVYVGKRERYGRLATKPNPEEFHVISMTKVLVE